MQVFLGDEVTLIHEGEDNQQPTFITGQVKGIVLNEHKKIERVFLHNLRESLWMSDGWKFVDDEEVVIEDD